MKRKKALDYLEAWDDFYLNVRPLIWADIPRNQRDQISKAQVARMGRAKRALGVDRVERILHQFAPGRYEVERKVVFWVDDLE